MAEKSSKSAAAKEAEASKPETVTQLKNRLRNEAEREVLTRHRDEVIEITGAKYAEHGLEYVRRLTDEEKAEKEILDLLQKHPELRGTIAAKLSPVQTVEVDGFGTTPINVP